jgi:hypothetical protein
MTSYVERLRGIGHFQRHPQMTPWVGRLYGQPGWKPLLFVGESHYLPPTSKIHLDARRWYASTRADLTEKEVAWTSIQQIVAGGHEQRYTAKAHRLFAKLEHALLAAGFPHRPQMLDYAAFYNFFQRPAETGVSIVTGEMDREQGAEVLRELLRVLEPSLVCVVSRLAWPFVRSVVTGTSVVADSFPHPASHWWNRRSTRYRLHDEGEPLTGSEKLHQFLVENRALLSGPGSP